MASWAPKRDGPEQAILPGPLCDLRACSVTLGRRSAAGPLAIAGLALLHAASLPGGGSRSGRPATARLPKSRRELLGEALQRQLPVSRLAASVLGDGGDQRADAFQQPSPLWLIKRRRRLDIEYRFDTRGGDIGMLTAGTGGTAGAQLNLTERERQPFVDSQLFDHGLTLTASEARRRC